MGKRLKHDEKWKMYYQSWIITAFGLLAERFPSRFRWSSFPSGTFLYDPIWFNWNSLFSENGHKFWFDKVWFDLVALKASLFKIPSILMHHRWTLLFCFSNVMFVLNVSLLWIRTNNVGRFERKIRKNCNRNFSH